MKRAKNFSIVLVTAPDLKTARNLACKALEAHLAACVNLVPRIESHYWWQGKLERGNEILMIFKTSRQCLSHLEKLILSEHPYDTPEFIKIPLAGGAARYIEWLKDSLGFPAKAPTGKI